MRLRTTDLLGGMRLIAIVDTPGSLNAGRCAIGHEADTSPLLDYLGSENGRISFLGLTASACLVLWPRRLSLAR
jgi:hypothetical protein